MNRFARTGFAIALAGLLAGGCASNGKKPAPTTRQAMAATVPSTVVIRIKPASDDEPRDPQLPRREMIRLVVFMLDMPAGSVSENAEFWKRVDELALGAANHDRLLRNGIRCGIAPLSESAFFSHFFDARPHTLSTSRVEGLQSDTFELPIDKQFDQQDLFIFNSSDQLQGRTYDRGSDQLILSFGPAPREPRAVRLTFCPVVQSERTRLEYTALSQEIESPVKDSEQIYDLGLVADVPSGSFFIIAPSSDAQRPSSIGGCFLIKHDKTEKKEQVIVVVPTLVPMDGTPVTLRDALIR